MNNNNKEQKSIQNPSQLNLNNKNIFNNLSNTNNNNSGTNIINNTENNGFNNIYRNNNSYMNNKNEAITNSIDDKYKNLENPFTTPDIPKKTDDEEKRAKIMDRINRGRKKVKSQSADKVKYNKSDDIQKLADNLEKHLFKDNINNE